MCIITAALFLLEQCVCFGYNHTCMGIGFDKSPDIAFHVIRSRRRTISVEIGKEGEILVRAPKRATNREITGFVEKNAGWIEKHKAMADSRRERVKDVPVMSETMLNHLMKLARKRIPERVALYAEKMGVTYGRISIRKQHTRWGSCTKEGNLSFNVLLMIAPEEVLDSVIVHELCHRIHMNHSKDFYEMVYQSFPEYDKWNQWLKANADLLMARLPGRK